MLYDLLIIGGGINGTAIARDAAGRGLSVCLCERDDLASHTSSASTKLIHGGLRYLEHYEFRLVRESLIEREVLLQAAPHIIRPLRFVLPYDKGLRPRWMLRLGLFLYDHIGGRKLLPGTKTVSLKKPPHKGVLESRLRTGFEYSDCWVEDARLVVLNALDAHERGADIRIHSEVTNLKATRTGYSASVRGAEGRQETLKAKAVVNAAGPWVDAVEGLLKHGQNASELRLIKGSHIVTKRLFAGDHAYIFQNADGRIVFAIPYEQDFTLIGTTDVPYDHAEGRPQASQAEIDYLCAAVSEYLAVDVTAQDVVWTYSGVRPLYDDHQAEASEVTRDYVLDMEEPVEGAPFMSVYGGKITSSRKLADHALRKFADYFPDCGPSWTETASIPGGEIDKGDLATLVDELQTQYPHVTQAQCVRLARLYGTRSHAILATGDLGQVFGDVLSEAEARYLVAHEWARNAEDILWRRTKAGLHMRESERQAFTRWFEKTALCP